MLNELASNIFEANKEKGFWDGERNIGELLMLVTSELSEALEAHRKGRKADRYGFSWKNDRKEDFEEFIKDSFEDEIADVVIRLLDMCGGLGIDIDFHVTEKLEYNKTRPHKHGKAY